MVKFERVDYSALNSRQQEVFNFQKVSGLLASFGYATYRLTDDWQGADFLAIHVDGQTSLKVQLKSRFHVAKKYQGKDLWICFRHSGSVYLFPHDEMLQLAQNKTKILGSGSWRKDDGGYSSKTLPKGLREALASYCLGKEAEPSV